MPRIFTKINKKNELEVLPVRIAKDIRDAKFKKLPPILMKPPFLTIIQAPVRSGKSNLIMWLVYKWYYHIFDEIIYISPTIQNDKTLKYLYKDKTIIKVNENLEDLDSILSIIVDEQNEIDEEDRDHKLIVLDDCLGFLNKSLAHLCSRYRHYKLSIIITSQSFRSVPVICRVNSSQYILFRTNNKKELAKLEEEFSGNFPSFMDLYNRGTQEKYSFLYLDNEKIEAHRNFTELLYKKD